MLDVELHNLTQEAVEVSTLIDARSIDFEIYRDSKRICTHRTKDYKSRFMPTFHQRIVASEPYHERIVIKRSN